MILSATLLALGCIMMPNVHCNFNTFDLINKQDSSLRSRSSIEPPNQNGLEERDFSELSIFMPSIDAFTVLYPLIIYALWWYFAKDSSVTKSFLVNVILDEQHGESANTSNIVNTDVDLDDEAKAGNWEYVEKCIRNGSMPSTTILCRAYCANKSELVSYILDLNDSLLYKPDFSIILSNQKCKPLIDKMITENHIASTNKRLLKLACRFGHARLVKYILKKSLIKVNGNHLGLAILSGDSHLVTYFIKDLNIKPGSNALELACYSKNTFLVQYLVENFEDILDYPSIQAVIYDADILRYFLQQKDYPLSHFLFKQAAMYGYFDSFDFLERSYRFELDIASLDNACFSGNLPFVKYLVEGRNIEPNLFNLDSAAINGQLEVVRYLINQRNLTHDYLVEDNAFYSKNKDLILFLKTKRRIIYNWFYLWDYYWFRRSSHNKLLKHQKVVFTDHKAKLKKLLIV